MAWTAKTVVNLPFIDVRKNVGDPISKKEMEDARQTNEDVKRLIKSGAIEES